MSETITIALSGQGALAEPLELLTTLDAISAALHVSDLRCSEDIPEPGTPWPPGVWHLFREGVSTRTTELTCSEDELAIRIFSLASPDDVALAVALAEYVAEHAAATEVTSETAGAMPTEELAAYYSADWAERKLESAYRVLSALIREGKGPIEVPGPQRSFCLGPRVLLQLGPDQPHRRLLEAVRRVQWIPVRTAGTFLANAKSDQREIKLAMWLGEEVFFPAVDFAGIAEDPTADKPAVFLIPAVRVPELAGDRWTAVDERQGLLGDFSGDWPALVAAARKFATTT